MKTQLGKKVRAKIDERLDRLERFMNLQIHISHPDNVSEIINSLSIYWAIMNDEDKDYIQCCQHARDEQLTWRPFVNEETNK